jgi:hypothetical protein
MSVSRAVINYADMIWADWGRADQHGAALGSYAPMKTGVPTPVTE